jgi:type VI secretion system secreted protein VgrG
VYLADQACARVDRTPLRRSTKCSLADIPLPVRQNDLRDTSIARSDSLRVGADATLTIQGVHATKVQKDQSIVVIGARSHEVQSDTFKVKTKLVIDAGSEIVFKTGSASITLSSNGNIAIKGKSISVNAADTVKVKATSDVSIKGARNAQN